MGFFKKWGWFVFSRLHNSLRSQGTFQRLIGWCLYRRWMPFIYNTPLYSGIDQSLSTPYPLLVFVFWRLVVYQERHRPLLERPHKCDIFAVLNKPLTFYPITPLDIFSRYAVMFCIMLLISPNEQLRPNVVDWYKVQSSRHCLFMKGHQKPLSCFIRRIFSFFVSPIFTLSP